MRLLADGSSLFTQVNGVDQTDAKLVQDLQRVTNWAYQWKMVFNHDLTEQAVEVIFSVKAKKLSILILYLMVYRSPVKIMQSIWGSS